MDQLNQAWDISQDLLSDKLFDFAGGNCTGLLNIQFVLLDCNLPWDMTTLWDHSQNATLQLDHAWHITSSDRNPSNLSFLERMPFSFPPRLLQFGNINTRSIRNKTAEFLHHVLDSGLGVCTITETWLSDQDIVSLGTLSPSGLNFENFYNSVFYSLSLNCPFFDGGEKSSFEFSQ